MSSSPLNEEDSPVRAIDIRIAPEHTSRSYKTMVITHHLLPALKLSRPNFGRRSFFAFEPP